MYKFDQIRHVHLEISSRCNANCPLCPRSFFGYPHNNGYTERDLTLQDAQHIFQPEFIQQLDELYINGNFGDAVMNPETIEIIEYFKSYSSRIQVGISTNGGARSAEFWRTLAELNVGVFFCIDGLEDTHHLYRQNTVYATVIKNARTFIDAGGHATWRMIDFDHNRHQQQTARELSESMGFKRFQLMDYGRNSSPVFDKQKQLTHFIGQQPEWYTDFDDMMHVRTTRRVQLAEITAAETVNPIECEVDKKKSIYVASTGDVYPCCYLGFEPKTFGRGAFHEPANAQFAHMIHRNNAIKHSLAECMAWFEEIEKTWSIPEFDQGRLVICNRQCGNCGSSSGKSAV
jgi:MoaA/NifB/PqqE/SkfB family radical SAM enzyme